MRGLVAIAPTYSPCSFSAEQAIDTAERAVAQAAAIIERQGIRGDHGAEGNARFKFVAATELESQPAPDRIVDGLILVGSFTLVVGEPGSMKSFSALDLSASLQLGQTWAGRKVKQGPVL
jgi:hypothetical protein